MHQILIHGLDELMISQEVTFTCPPALIDLRLLIEAALRHATGQVARRRSGLYAPDRFDAGDFDLRTVRQPGGRYQIQAYLQPEALHLRLQPTWDCATTAMDAVLEALSGHPNVGLNSVEPRILRSIHFHVDVQGYDFRGIQLARFRRPGGAKVRVTYGRALQLESIEIGDERLMIYDKSAEIEANPRKAYVKPLWVASQHYDASAPVWRLEYKTKLREDGHSPPYDINAIWRKLLECIWLAWGDSRAPLWRDLADIRFVAPWPADFGIPTSCAVIC